MAFKIKRRPPGQKYLIGDVFVEYETNTTDEISLIYIVFCEREHVLPNSYSFVALYDPHFEVSTSSRKALVKQPEEQQDGIINYMLKKSLNPIPMPMNVVINELDIPHSNKDYAWFHSSVDNDESFWERADHVSSWDEYLSFIDTLRDEEHLSFLEHKNLLKIRRFFENRHLFNPIPFTPDFL